VGCGPAKAHPRCTKCNNPLINCQCTNFVLFVLLTSWLCSFNAAIKGLKIFYTNMVTHKDPFFARGCTVKLNILSIIEQNFVPKFKKN